MTGRFKKAMPFVVFAAVARRRCLLARCYFFLCLHLQAVSSLLTASISIPASSFTRADQSAFIGFRGDVSYYETMGAAAETTIGDECHALAETGANEGRSGLEHFGHAGAPLGPTFLMTTTSPARILPVLMPLIRFKFTIEDHARGQRSVRLPYRKHLGYAAPSRQGFHTGFASGLVAFNGRFNG